MATKQKTSLSTWAVLIMFLIWFFTLGDEDKTTTATTVNKVHPQQIKCNKAVKEVEELWSRMADESQTGWGSKMTELAKEFEKKQPEARKECFVDGHIYDNAYKLNDMIKKYGQAGGFGHPLN